VDVERGLVFVPLGSASYDFYGGDRRGANLYASSLVALDAATGRLRWHQQLVHHDLWDFDPPAQPILVDVPRQEDGSRRTIPAVVQLTKMGLVFVFNRETGAPLFGMEERPVPASDLDGEQASPTQPFPLAPASLSRHVAITESDLTTVTPESRRECEALFAGARSGGIYTPPSQHVTVSVPGTMGGATWSGGAVDPGAARLFVNTNVWKRLPADVREIIRVASISAVTQRNMILARETAEACQDLIKGGTQMHRTPDDILKNFLDEWEKIQSEYAKKDPFYKKVIDSQRKYAELIVPFRMSWYPPYDFAGKYYWKDKIYLKTQQ